MSNYYEKMKFEMELRVYSPHTQKHLWDTPVLIPHVFIFIFLPNAFRLSKVRWMEVIPVPEIKDVFNVPSGLYFV